MSNAALTSRLEVLRASQKFSEAVLAGFARHLSEAPDEALFRMSPVRYAAAVSWRPPIASMVIAMRAARRS